MHPYWLGISSRFTRTFKKQHIIPKKIKEELNGLKDRLVDDPHSILQPLTGNLLGYHSLHLGQDEKGNTQGQFRILAEILNCCREVEEKCEHHSERLEGCLGNINLLYIGSRENFYTEAKKYLTAIE